MQAHGFELPDQNGKMVKLSDFLGKWIVLYFYPKDDTPGCTKEACNFRDSIKEFEKRGVVILGVSKDSVESHQKFAKKYHLNFPLLSDIEKHVLKAYKAWGKKTFLGKTYDGTFRKTYLIDPKGEIKKVYEKVIPFNHASEILKELGQLFPKENHSANTSNIPFMTLPTALSSAGSVADNTSTPFFERIAIN